MRIRVCAEFELAAAEHLGLERGQFRMDLQADDRFPILEHFFELLHVTHQPLQELPERMQEPLEQHRSNARVQQLHGTCSRHGTLG